MKKLLKFATAILIALVAGIFVWQYSSCGSDIPMAPIYAYEMLEETKVGWILDDDQIGGGATISHRGELDHEYQIIMSIVSDTGQKFASSTGKGPIQTQRQYGWSDTGESTRDTIDWPTARIWCEIRIYDEGGTVVFHGIKRSDLYTEAVSKANTSE